ncbi:ABC transporter permease [Pseudonocardia alaniniphila]|uniref:ABC transporter permease n=1 Tax=Pseudonocardia alaniniphila TaxID=75291 RepID=A0ABS9T7I0_9PSEU|nr:ABC transporter permease [Pseudonocardia alaniniphila]MCH6164493.1 ABC transporter permease [Pseudonocardia alaniniphila]
MQPTTGTAPPPGGVAGHAAAPATAARGSSTGDGSRLRTVGLGLSGIVGVVVVLELVVRTGLLPHAWFPPPSEIVPAFVGLVTSGELFVPLGQTLQGWVLGIAAAVVVAVPLGVLIGSLELAHRLTRFMLEFLRPIPPVALIPAAVLIFGSDLDMKVFLIAFGTFWPVLLQTVYGVHDVDPTARDTARSYGLTPRAVLVRVTLPSALPYIATGLRIASAIGLILAVTSEIVVGVPGIGGRITDAQSAGGAEALMYAWILAAGLLGWMLNSALQTTERRVLHWHPSFRGGNR